jgi:serine protease inhibitor
VHCSGEGQRSEHKGRAEAAAAAAAAAKQQQVAVTWVQIMQDKPVMGNGQADTHIIKCA